MKNTTIKCPIFDNGHQLNYDEEMSHITQSVYHCLCGFEVTEQNDNMAGG